MEFIVFLDRIEIEIIRIVEEAGYSIKENSSLCLLSEKYAGFLIKKDKKIVICTENAKKRAGYTNRINQNINIFERTAIHIKKALRHEAVHVAQECNNGNLLEINKKLSINKTKFYSLRGYKVISG